MKISNTSKEMGERITQMGRDITSKNYYIKGKI
jgi:hypothetical protein